MRATKTALYSGSTKQLTQILNAVADGITVQNTQGELVYVNKAAAKMMNLPNPETAMELGGGKILSTFEYFNEQGRPVTPAQLPGRLALTGVDEPAMIVSYKSGSQAGIRWSSIKAMPVYDEAGNVEFAVNLIQDITKLKETELHLREANQRITKLLQNTLKCE